jgi:hypothetical protein
VDALRIILELGVQAVGVQEGSVLILDAPAQELVFLMTGGDILSEGTLKGQRVRVGDGLTGMAARTGEIQVGVPAYRAVHQPAHHNYKPPTQIIAAPMAAEKSIVGVLTAASYVPGCRFSNDEVRMFQRIAALAGIVVAERKHSWSGDGPLFGLPAACTGSQEVAWW